MKHKVTYRTPNGVLQETMFDQFDEFCDNMENVATEYYQGLKEPGDVNIESVLDDGSTRAERVSFDGRVTGEVERAGENTPLAVGEVDDPGPTDIAIGAPHLDVSSS